MTVDQTLQVAVGHHTAGRAEEAEKLYRQVLKQAPKHADALHLLGLLMKQKGQREAGIELIQRAIAAAPDRAGYHSNLGNIYNDLGRVDEAIGCYRKALALNPHYAEGHNNLGNALRAKGELEGAIASFHHAIQLKPDISKLHANLASAFSAKGKTEDAIASYRRALELTPSDAELHNELGNACCSKGDREQAEQHYRRALALKPDYAQPHNNLGNICKEKQDLEQAIDCYHQAIEIDPKCAGAHYNLGNAWNEKGDLAQATACFRRAAELDPQCVEAHYNLGNLLMDQGKVDEAIAAYHRALEVNPKYSDARNNLGEALLGRGQIEEGIACFQRALELNPDCVEAVYNLGNGWKESGQLDDALACYRRALEMKPDCRSAYDNLLFVSHYHPVSDRQSLFELARGWNEQHARPLKERIRPHTNSRDFHRRLRVGYVSPDLRGHAVGRFIRPLLNCHDPHQVEVFCYTLSARRDALTDVLRSSTRGWRDLTHVKDEAAAEMIRQDGIDILVDLAMHTAGNRLGIFARKPAPVQVTYLAYAGGTGVEAIDYRLTDRYLDPDESEDRFYLEKSLRLKSTYWCYEQTFPVPGVTPLPALANGCINFGCLNNFCKVSDEVMELWSRLLEEVADSHLLLYCPSEARRQPVREFFRQRGIDAHRLELLSQMSLEAYFNTCLKMDIALDPFPYSGGTTTCDALWMGAPVITLAGRTAVGRSGVSLLSTLGHPEWIAWSLEDYLRIASELASDRPRLSAIRQSLRGQMRASPLMDAPRFTRDIESAYRTMWQAWCAEPKP